MPPFGMLDAENRKRSDFMKKHIFIILLAALMLLCACQPTPESPIVVGKDNEDRYYGGGYFGSQDARTVWGLVPCVTTAVNQGEIVVGAWKTCASVVQNGGVSVDMTNSDVDDFQKNLMTIRAEERFALAVRRPKGFKVITKGAGGATGQS